MLGSEESSPNAGVLGVMPKSRLILQGSKQGWVCQLPVHYPGSTHPKKLGLTQAQTHQLLEVSDDALLTDWTGNTFTTGYFATK